MEPIFFSDLDARLIADYFIARDECRDDADVTQMKLHKLMYFAQANYLAETGRRLFSSKIYAFEHGPVVDAIRSDFQEYGRAAIVVKDDAVAFRAKQRCAEIPQEIRQFLDAIWDKYGEESASQLRRLSHQDKPWSDAYVPSGRFCVITDEAIRDYYREPDKADSRVRLDRVFFIDEHVWAALDELDATL